MEEAKQQSQAEAQVQAAEVAALQARVEMNRDAYLAGEKAKRNGWYKVSPFYGDHVSDQFFEAGFDGIPWERAIRGEFHAA